MIKLHPSNCIHLQKRTGWDVLILKDERGWAGRVCVCVCVRGVIIDGAAREEVTVTVRVRTQRITKTTDFIVFSFMIL